MIKKLIILAFLIVTFLTLVNGQVFAAEPNFFDRIITNYNAAISDQSQNDATNNQNDYNNDETRALKNTQFNVRSILTTEDDAGNDNQDFSYFPSNTEASVPQYSPLVTFILSMMDFATAIMGSIAVLLFIVAGFKFMTAGANDQAITEAKDIIRYAIIGMAMTFFSYIIVIFIQNIFNKG